MNLTNVIIRTDKEAEKLLTDIISHFDLADGNGELQKKMVGLFQLMILTILQFYWFLWTINWNDVYLWNFNWVEKLFDELNSDNTYEERWNKEFGDQYNLKATEFTKMFVKDKSCLSDSIKHLLSIVEVNNDING